MAVGACRGLYLPSLSNLRMLRRLSSLRRSNSKETILSQSGSKTCLTSCVIAVAVDTSLRADYFKRKQEEKKQKKEQKSRYIQVFEWE